MSSDRTTTELRRTVRFSINPDGSTQGQNNFAGTPASSGLSRYYEITLGVLGIPAPDTGYLIGIQEVDALVRRELLPIIGEACSQTPERDPAGMLDELWHAASTASHQPLSLLRWALSPYYCVEMTTPSQHAREVLLRQTFEFAGAHRLHTPSMSDEENAAFFGKCNNPSGHGHNYRLEPTIAVPLESVGRVNAQRELQRAVNEILLEQLDHTFLNSDCAWFNQSAGGVIPSVENIARVCFEQLAPAIESIGHGLRLVRLQAWETEKTSAIYPA